jgi:hypothetical protein
MIANMDYRALGAGVVLQAFEDLKGDNPLKAIDALLWLIGDCPLWLDGLGLDLDPVKLLTTGKVKAVKFGEKQRA